MCKNGSVCLFEEASYLVLNFRAFNSLDRFLVLCHSTYYKVEGYWGRSSQLEISVQGLLALLLWLMVWQNVMAGSRRWEQSSSPVARQEVETDRTLKPAAPSPTFNAPGPAAYRPVQRTHGT